MNPSDHSTTVNVLIVLMCVCIFVANELNWIDEALSMTSCLVVINEVLRSQEFVARIEITIGHMFLHITL